MAERVGTTGLYDALNQAVEALPSDITHVVFLNDDDVLLPEAKEFYLRVHLAGADVGIGRSLYIDGQGGDLFRASHWPFCFGMRELCSRDIVPFLQVATVVRVSLLRQLQGFDVAYQVAGDLDFFLRCFERTKKLYVSMRVVASFRVAEGQLSGNEALRQRETDRTILAHAERGHLVRYWLALVPYRFLNLPGYVCRLMRHGRIKTRQFYTK